MKTKSNKNHPLTFDLPADEDVSDILDLNGDDVLVIAWVRVSIVGPS